MLDNARLHHAKAVRAYLKGNRLLELLFLPPYAPDINPVELFNNALKTEIRKKAVMSRKDLIAFARDFMDGKSDAEEYFRSFFMAEKTRYANVA